MRTLSNWSRAESTHRLEVFPRLSGSRHIASKSSYRILLPGGCPGSMQGLHSMQSLTDAERLFRQCLASYQNPKRFMNLDRVSWLRIAAMSLYSSAHFYPPQEWEIGAWEYTFASSH